MINELEHLQRIRDSADALIAARTSGAVATEGTDDPMTSPLTPEGGWVPPYLAQYIRLTLLQNPELYGPEEYDFASGTFKRKPIRFPRALIMQQVLQRTDLSESQRAFVQACNDEAFADTLTIGGSVLADREIDAPMTGGYLTAIATYYTNDRLPLLEQHIREYFVRECGTRIEDEV